MSNTINNLKVSIIVPVYNLERYVEICARSLMSQTYRNIEIILVNDGSKDGSLEIIKRVANLDSRIIIVDQENAGVSAARNSGIEHATGDCIMFVDGDDFVEPNFVEDLLKIKIEYDADIVSCNHSSVDDNGSLIKNGCNTKKVKKMTIDQIIEGFCSGTYMYMVWNKLFDRKVLQNIHFELNMIYEEVAYFNSIILKNPTIYHIEKPLYNYRCARLGNTKSTFSYERNMRVKKDFDTMLLELNKISALASKKYQYFVMTQYMGYYLQAYKCNCSKNERSKIFRAYKDVFYFNIPLFIKLNRNLIKAHVFFRIAPDIYSKYQQSKG